MRILISVIALIIVVFLLTGCEEIPFYEPITPEPCIKLII